MNVTHLYFLPVILTCVTGTKTQKTVLWALLDFLIGVKWHGRGRRFEPDQVHQPCHYFETPRRNWLMLL